MNYTFCRAVGSTNSTAVSTVPGNQQQSGGQQQQHRQQTAPSQQHQVNISYGNFKYWYILFIDMFYCLLTMINKMPQVFYIKDEKSASTDQVMDSIR